MLKLFYKDKKCDQIHLEDEDAAIKLCVSLSEVISKKHRVQ